MDVPPTHDVIIPVPGRSRRFHQVVWVCWNTLVAIGGLLFLGWSSGSGHRLLWWEWTLGGLILLQSWVGIFEGLSRIASEPSGLKIQGGYLRVQWRGGGWSHWHSAPDLCIPLESVEFIRGYNRLMLCDRMARTASIILADGSAVMRVCRQLESEGFVVPESGETV